jgi:integrase
MTVGSKGSYMPSSTTSLSELEQEILLAWCSPKVRDPNLRLRWLARLTLVFYYFGMHPVVVGRFHAWELRTDGRFLMWRRAKTGTPIEFPISPQITEWLPEFLEFLHTMSPKQLSNDVHEAGIRMGLKGLCPRALRHTVASRLLEKYDLNVAKSLTGTTDKILLHYARRAATRSALGDIANRGF